jgi:hypothetical protein
MSYTHSDQQVTAAIAQSAVHARRFQQCLGRKRAHSEQVGVYHSRKPQEQKPEDRLERLCGLGKPHGKSILQRPFSISLLEEHRAFI